MIKYKKISKRFSTNKLRDFFNEALPGKTLRQCEDIIKKSQIIGAFKENKLIGIVRSLDDGVYGFITDVIVSPKYRKRGIGKKLVRMICQELIHKKIKMIHCSVNKKLVPFFQSAFNFEYDPNETTLYFKNFNK